VIKSITSIGKNIYILRGNEIFENREKFCDVEATNIVAGAGKCGNFRIFATKGSLLFAIDLISKEIKDLISIKDEIVSISKDECKIYLATNEKVYLFNLEDFSLSEI
jgi:hypothetical protein